MEAILGHFMGGDGRVSMLAQEPKNVENKDGRDLDQAGAQ